MTVTVQQVIRLMQAEDDVAENSVDMLEFGSPEMEVRGIATAFKATQDVVEEAVRLGANLLITHESVFYSHRDHLEQRLGGSVAQQKRHFIEKAGIAIYRNHDAIHLEERDGITLGLLQRLEWEPHVVEHLPHAAIVELPAANARLQDVATHVKRRLGLSFVRLIGDLDKPCQRIGILVGYRGGSALAIPLMEDHKADLLLVGEGPEWETPEYVRDAIQLGQVKALMVLGHAESEDAGMQWLADRLRRQLADQLGNRSASVPVHFIPAKPLFSIFGI